MRKFKEIGKMGKWYYAVANGRNTGIYQNWSECQSQVDGYSGAKFKKFSSVQDAQSFVDSSRGSASGYSSGSSSGYSGGSSSGYAGGSSGGYSSGYRRESSTSAYDDYRAPSSTPRRTISIDHPREKHMNFKRDQYGRVDVYTDGACSSNGRRGATGGVGVWFDDNHALNVSRPLEGRQTNNRAEIQAAIDAIDKAKSAGITKLNINTDSKFLIQSYNEWMPRWKSNGWKTANNQPVSHKEEFLELERKMADIDARLVHVPAHAGIHGNERADKLARDACS